MSGLGALSQAWVTAEASLPLGWQLMGVARADSHWGIPGVHVPVGKWVAWATDPENRLADYLTLIGTGDTPHQALSRLADELRIRRGPTTG